MYTLEHYTARYATYHRMHTCIQVVSYAVHLLWGSMHRPSPLTRSTRYSWLGVMSRYCTMAFMVGMELAFTTAACFRLLILASIGTDDERRNLIEFSKS